MTEKMYEMICKGEFEKLEKTIDDNHKETLAALKGDEESPGLCERVRILERAYERIVKFGVFIFAAVGLQFIDFVASFVKGLFKK